MERVTEKLETCGIEEVGDIVKNQFEQLVEDQLLSRVDPVVIEAAEEPALLSKSTGSVADGKCAA